MMDNSKCGRKSLGLGVLVISQILCLAQADGTKPNGWDSVLDRIKSDLNSNGGAEKPSSVLRGTERERELKHKGSNWSGSKNSHSKSKSKSHKPSSQPQEGTEDIVAVSQMKLDGMTVEECLAMGDFMSRSCTDCSIMFNKCELTYPDPKDSGGAVFMYNYDAYNKVYDNIEQYQQQFPLTCADYPISNNELKMTAVMASNAISVRDYSSETMSHCIMDVMYALGINKLPPNPPCRDEQRRRLGDDDAMLILEAQADEYWPELEEVLDYQILRIKYGDTPAGVVFPADFPLPASWRGYTVNQVAQAVFDEPPCYHQARHFHQVFAGRYGEFEQDYNVMPATGAYSEFVDGIIAAYRICIDTVHHIGHGNFALKWYVGRARPEETLWIIHNCMENGECDERLPMEYVPQSIKDKISEYAAEFANKAIVIDGNSVTPPHTSGTVTAATHFTAYRPGSPVHGSYPAMHSAASNWSFVCQIVYKATPQMVCEAIKTDFAVSKARTVAGVHFRLDNVDGLNIGQEQAARFLDYYFMEMGGDIDYIRQKIADKRFDWRQVNMAVLGDVDCEQATAADLARAGVSSFAGANSDRFGTSDGALPQEQFSVAAGDGDTGKGVVDNSPPAFNFDFACAANPWGP